MQSEVVKAEQLLSWGILCTFVAFATLLSSCALYSVSSTAKAVVKECSVPEDQSATISGAWPVIPVPLAFHAGDFESSEITDMTTAAETWNSFYNSSLTIKTLDADASRTSSTNNPTLAGSLCAVGIVPGNQFIGNVVIYKNTKWPASYSPNAMALTSFCVLPAKPFPKMYMAIMEINYQNFFVSGTKVPDLQSIILHELGHLLGLNHSCETTTRRGTPNCNDPNINPDYVSASMYPIFGFDASGAGQVKRELGPNDQSRANCLYSKK